MSPTPRLLPLALAGLLATGALAAGPDEVAASAAEVHPLLVGAAVPNVQVRAADGEAVALPALLAGKPTVLLFYRGGW